MKGGNALLRFIRFMLTCTYAHAVTIHDKKNDLNTMKFIESQEEWSALMEESKSKLVVVDFTASWCG